MLSSYDVSDATAAMITSLGAATGNLKLTVVSLLVDFECRILTYSGFYFIVVLY